MHINFYCDDCLAGMSSMPDDSVDVTLTDIPYEFINKQSGGLRTLDKGAANDFNFDIYEMLEEVYRITKNQVIMFCGKEQFSTIFDYFSVKDGTTRTIVWEKTNPSPMNGQYVYLSGVELAVWFKPHKRGVFNEHCKNTVFKHANSSRKIHPTQKSIALIEEIILDNSNEGDIIFDPFTGSGTTGVAAVKNGRSFYGFEIDDKFYMHAKNRITKAWQSK